VGEGVGWGGGSCNDDEARLGLGRHSRSEFAGTCQCRPRNLPRARTLLRQALALVPAADAAGEWYFCRGVLDAEGAVFRTYEELAAAAAAAAAREWPGVVWGGGSRGSGGSGGGGGGSSSE
jgi:hypothetical protein